MAEKLLENFQKNAKKGLKNKANPRGMGVIRFSVAEILINTPWPITVTEIENLLKKNFETANRKLIYKILEEMKLTAGLPLLQIIKRVGRTQCPAYYIQKPKRYELRKFR